MTTPMHGARLIASTQPFNMAECINGEDLIAYCARVSNPANQGNTETAPRLISYLVRNQHWSPFEMVSATMEIVTTRDIARQILRHRSFSFQEFSQRYAVNVAAPVIRETRMQHATNRQASVENDDEALHNWWQDVQHELAVATQETYARAIKQGIAKEVARSVLPEGMTESRLYMAGTVRSWIHYVNLRTEAGTQKEHRKVAEACGAALLAHFPSLSEVLL